MCKVDAVEQCKKYQTPFPSSSDTKTVIHHLQNIPLPTLTSQSPRTPLINMLEFTVFRNIINGALVDTRSHRQGILPAAATPHYDVPVSTQEDLDSAVRAANIAFPAWRDTPMKERKRLVLEFADALERETPGFVKLLTTEQGKPVCPIRF